MTTPTIILPGYLAGASDYASLRNRLEEAGLPAIVVPLQWWEWLPTVGGRSIAPILHRLDAAVQSTLAQFQSSQVNLVCHSAGGWIARIYLGEKPYDNKVWHRRSQVANLVTLGTPHFSREPWTASNLGFVNDNYPGAYYKDVRYICIAGKSVFGERKLTRPARWLAYSSYELTCGEGKTWGDGITPIAAAHLEGAENAIVEGAKHSPKSDRWYGTPELLGTWVTYLQN